MGVRPLAWHQQRWHDGRTLLHTPLGQTVETVFGFPHVQVPRANLLNARRDALPPNACILDIGLQDVPTTVTMLS